jgi:hypothetical protein
MTSEFSSSLWIGMKHMILHETLLYLSALGKRINLLRKKYLGYDLDGNI